MLKLRKVFVIIFSFIFVIFGLCFSGSVEAAEPEIVERADMSNIDFEWVTDSPSTHSSVSLKVKNVNLIKENTYYVHFSHNKDEVVDVEETEDVTGNSNFWTAIIYGYGMENPIEKLINSIRVEEDFIATNGDIYIWICELDNHFSNPKIVVEARKIERLEQLPLGQRLSAFFNKDSTDIFSHEPYGGGDRKVNVKVGVVTDKNILQAIKNKEADGMQKLLTYAKSADAVRSDTFPLGSSKKTLLNNGDDEYYYVYMELDDEKGTYYPVEDVSVYKFYGLNLYNCLDDNFKWDLEYDTNETNKSGDNTTAKGILPKAGHTYMIVSVVLTVIVFIIITGIKLKKYKNVE